MTKSPLYPWFDTLWRQWLTQLSSQKLGHAYLLIGAAGWGKQSFLIQLAAAVLCHKQAEAPCGVCPSCHWLSVQTHPDYLMAETTGSIGIDVVRQWQDACYQTPAVGNYKVMVLPNCERLTVAAANALLKILEEPPASCVWLLSSSHRSELPATLVSRCQLLTCRPAPFTQAMAWLQQSLPEQPPLMLQQALHSVNGAPIAAQQWLQTESVAQRKQCYQQLQQYLNKQVTSHAVYQSLWPSLQNHLPQFILGWVMDMIRTQQVGEQAIINREYAPLIAELSNRVSNRLVWQWYDQLLALRKQAVTHVNFGYWFLQWLLQLDREYCCE